jgi:multidrug resistance efflux pump
MNRDTELLKERAEAQLREWKGRLEAWQAKLDQQKLGAEQSSRETLASLRAQVEQARERLAHLQNQGRDASGDLRKRFDKAWKELEDGFEQARRRFER